MRSAKTTLRLLVTFTVMLLSQSVLLAVSPLVTDDADTVSPGQLQINSDFTFTQTDSTTLYSVPINPVAGLLPSLELGAVFGYQWRQGPGSASTTGDANSVTDLTISPKFRLGEVLEGKLKFSARIDLTLPTASDRHGLGTGNVDAGPLGSRPTPSEILRSILMPATTRSILPEQISRMTAGSLVKRFATR